MLSTARQRGLRRTLRTILQHAATVAVQHVFVLDVDDMAATRDEREQLRDLVYVNQPTNYDSIIVKSLRVLMEGVARRASYVLKADSDSYIDVERIFSSLKVACPGSPCPNLYYGFLYTSAPVITRRQAQRDVTLSQTRIGFKHSGPGSTCHTCKAPLMSCRCR